MLHYNTTECLRTVSQRTIGYHETKVVSILSLVVSLALNLRSSSDYLGMNGWKDEWMEACMEMDGYRWKRGWGWKDGWMGERMEACKEMDG